MAQNGSAVLVLVLFAIGIVAVAGGIIVYQVRLRRKIAAAGPDGIRVRLRANRLGYAAPLVPAVEELLRRVERLEADVATLRASPPRPPTVGR